MNKQAEASLDVDYIADTYRKSISELLFILAKALISWQAKKQLMVAISTVDFKYRSLAKVIKKAIWLGYLLKNLKFLYLELRTINCNN